MYIYRKHGALGNIESKWHKTMHTMWILLQIYFMYLGTQVTLTSSFKWVGTCKEISFCYCQNYPRAPNSYDIQLLIIHWIIILNTSIQNFQTDRTLWMTWKLKSQTKTLHLNWFFWSVSQKGLFSRPYFVISSRIP